MKPKHLYHGSGKKLKILIPRKAKDLDGKIDNSLNGIYASSWKKWSIVMGIFGCKGVKGASTHITGRNKIDAVLYFGHPKQSHFYLHFLSSKDFINIPKKSPQWVSLKPVEPIKIERIAVKDYIHLIRKATKKEKEDWLKKHKI